MISQYDVVRALRNLPEDSNYRLDEAEQNVVNKDTGDVVCSVSEYTNRLRKKYHCDFEIIYEEHASMTVIYRCTECGTIIFGGDDEDRYDQNLECPTCGGYKTYLKHWTKAEIDADVKKQEALQFYVRMMAEMEAQVRRRKKRGLADWEVCKKNIKTKNGQITFLLECTNLFHSGLKGLNCKIIVLKNVGDGFMTKTNEIYIPLSWMALKVWKHRRDFKKECNANETVA